MYDKENINVLLVASVYAQVDTLTVKYTGLNGESGTVSVPLEQGKNRLVALYRAVAEDLNWPVEALNIIKDDKKLISELEIGGPDLSVQAVKLASKGILLQKINEILNSQGLVVVDTGARSPVTLRVDDNQTNFDLALRSKFIEFSLSDLLSSFKIYSENLPEESRLDIIRRIIEAVNNLNTENQETITPDADFYAGIEARLSAWETENSIGVISRAEAGDRTEHKIKIGDFDVTIGAKEEDDGDLAVMYFEISKDTKKLLEITFPFTDDDRKLFDDVLNDVILNLPSILQS